MVASFCFALWNRGVFVDGKVIAVRRHDEDAIPPAIPDELAFEGDELQIEHRAHSPGAPRGPVRVTGQYGAFAVSFAAGVVTKQGFAERMTLGPMRRGPVAGSGWEMESGDPLGLFVTRNTNGEKELSLVLPRFASLRTHSLARELEASFTSPRAGSGTEVFGVREYRPGDPLRRIHWRSTARRGKLIVREFEPPAVQNLGIFLDAKPSTDAEADQVARVAASEAWDCIRAGGRVTLWAPGCEPSRPDEQRNMIALLQWLARYPRPSGGKPPAPRVGAVVAVTTRTDHALLDAVEDVRSHGGPARAWVIGDGPLDADADIEVHRAGLEWPL